MFLDWFSYAGGALIKVADSASSTVGLHGVLAKVNQYSYLPYRTMYSSSKNFFLLTIFQHFSKDSLAAEDRPVYIIKTSSYMPCPPDACTFVDNITFQTFS